VTGLEFSDYAARVARESSGCPVLAGDILGPIGTDERFDVINATEVIEHVRDPMAFFGRIRSLLRPDGLFVYSTGNVESAYARACGRRWPYLHPEGHLFYFSGRTLERYFEAVGLRPVRIASLARDLRHRIETAEGSITHSQVRYVGHSSPGLKGAVFAVVGSILPAVAEPSLAWFQGRLDLPFAIKPARIA